MDTGTLARGGVIAGGAILLALLFFADKSHLKSDKDALPPTSQAKNQANASQLPPLSPDAATQKWIDLSEQAQGKDLTSALDSVIASLSARNRFDHALVYAEKKIKVDSSLKNLQLAGEIALKASRLDAINADSVLFRTFSQKSIQYLEAATKQDSLNEKSLLSLGTAYIESKMPENSMKGILTIRKVTEINPKNTEAQLQLGLRSLQTGQFEKAETRFTKVLEIEAKNEWAKYYLAVAKKELGKTAEAQKLAAELAKETKDADLKQKLNELFTP